jgi:hypothetical protein
VIRVGDVIAYKRNFSVVNTIIEKDVLVGVLSLGSFLLLLKRSRYNPYIQRLTRLLFL